MTEQPPGYPPPPPPPPPPGGYGYPPPTAGGYGYPPPSGYPPPQNVGTNALAVASLVCSLFGWICLFIGALAGVILGFVALSQIKRTGQRGRGMAIAGIIIGSILLALGITLWSVSAMLRHTPVPDTGASAVVQSVELQAV